MNQESSSFHSGFVAIVGRPNVGKSTLLNKILGQKVAITTHKPQTTRNRILGIHHRPDGQILFLDTPGIHRGEGKLNRYMVDQALTACRDVDAVLFLVEATDRPGGGDDFILQQLAQGNAPVILVINKIDQLPREQLLPLIDIYRSKFDFQGIVPVSALSGSGVSDLVQTVFGLLPNGPRYYPEDMVTDLPERFIVGEIIREQVMLQIHDEIPYRVAVQIDTFHEKPTQNLVVIQASIIVERDTHKGILIGKGGTRIRALGQSSRTEIERLLGTRVFLELFIKVQKNWTDSERLLKEFGYQ